MKSKNYDAVIIEQSELKKTYGEEFPFFKGFYDEHRTRTDFWNELEKHFNRPIVSVRPSGREGWDEIIILLAKGFIDENGTRILDYQEASELEDFFIDVFHEFSNDEYKVFNHYGSTCSEEVWKEIDEWVHETW